MLTGGYLLKIFATDSLSPTILLGLIINHLIYLFTSRIQQIAHTHTKQNRNLIQVYNTFNTLRRCCCSRLCLFSMIVVHEPLSNKVFVILDVLVQFLELPHLQIDYHTNEAYQQQRRI